MPTKDPLNTQEASSPIQAEQNQVVEKPQGELQHRHHSRHHHAHGTHKPANKTSRQKSSFETFLASYLLRALALLLFIGGLFWLMFKGSSREAIQRIILNFTSAEDHKELAVTYGGEFMTAILRLLPGLALLTLAYLSGFVFNWKKWLTFTLFYTGILLLYTIHLFDNLTGSFITDIMPYFTLHVSLLVTLVISVPVLYFTWRISKPEVHIYTIVFIYLSAIILWHGYNGANTMVMAMVLSFIAILYLFTGKASEGIVNAVNAYFAIGYFLLYFLRKFFIQDHPELVWFYVSYSSVLYLLLMLVHILRPYTGKRAFMNYFYHSVIFTVTGFYFISVWYVLRKYEPVYLQWLFALAVTVVNYGILRFKARISAEQSTDPYYFVFALVAATLIPLLVQTGKSVLFASAASLIFTAYAVYRKNQFAAFTAIGMLILAMLIYLAKMVVSYYPALFLDSDQLPVETFLAGLLSGAGITAAAFVLKRYFDSFRFSYIPKWFSKSGTSKSISIFFYTSLYLTSFWIFQYLFSAVFHVIKAQLVSWYIFHLTFTLMAQLFLINKKSWIYKPLLWISLVSFSVIPIVFTFSVSPLRDLALANGGGASGSFYFHFICIPVLSLLVPNTINHLRKYYPKVKNLTVWSMIYMICFFGYLLLAEFDHISVIAATTLTPERIIESNRHLPYSIVLYFASLVLLWFSFTRKIKFFRQLSLGVLILTTVKVFGFDFSSFNTNGQAVSFWVVGILLILYSFLYQWLRKKAQVSASTPRRTRSRHHRDKVTKVN